MRDDFAKRTIDILAKRVNYRCSNPNCRKPTSGPREDPTKAVNIGVAAHITAASEGGSRYDPRLTSEERKHPDNGIWLCWNCSKLIDNDPERYPTDLLHQWKRQAEQMALDELEHRVPLREIPAPDAVTSFDLARYRERMISLYGTTQIFGQPRPVPLGDIYTDVYLLDKPSAFRRIDISQLKEDRNLPEGAERIQGLTLLHQDEAHRLFILGKPGSGKTTFLKHIALEAAKGNLDRIPIFVTLKEWADSSDFEEGLLPFIARQFAICGIPQATSFIEHLLEKTDDALLFFDGLDEVQRERGVLDRVIAVLHDFSRQYPRAQFLVTCRTAATDYTFEDFAYVEVADFTAEQMETYVRKWFHAAPAKARAFLTEIAQEQYRGLRELARVPLLLALFCLAFGDILSFPGGRAGAYRDALDALLRRWDDSRRVHRDEIYGQLSLERKHQLFASIAVQTFEQGDHFVPQHQLESMISRYLAALSGRDASGYTDIDAYAVLKAIEAQHGILVEWAHRIYSFAHISFQEYYAARYMVDNEARGTFPSLLAHCTDDRWHEVILLTASLLDDADVFFVDFRRAVDAVVADDEPLVAFLSWAASKTTGVDADLTVPALRSYYSYFALTLARAHDLACALALYLARALARDRDRAFALDLGLARLRAIDLALALNLDSALVRTRDLARALTSEPIFARDIADGLTSALARARSLALNLTIERDRASDPAYSRDLARALARALAGVWSKALDLSQRLGVRELHDAFSALPIPAASSSPEAFQAFAEALRGILTEHRIISHGWEFAPVQTRHLADYYGANHLLLQCLDLAVVSNRQAIEDSLLLPPGGWTTEGWTN
jgi:hypothetical protein